ncbi:hypothetical protein HZD78_21495 [Mycobacteroides chelonae]|uniref:hypothetical protein n=1 Tax=Mycobacteroides chelonae TaxID=1774 RepID=UPI001C45389E|nr:hypothetical protein [Mycobacteroides chelonae]MBV6362529.1 hypothetical protein [Mycobacteroides chelonae]
MSNTHPHPAASASDASTVHPAPEHVVDPDAALDAWRAEQRALWYPETESQRP